MTAEYRSFLYEIITPIMAALIVVLNILELFTILRNKSKRGVGVVYIINLSASDVFVGISMIILKIMTQFRKTTLKNDAVGIEFYNIIRYCVIRISLFVSVFNLSALTIDRLLAIKYPFIHRKQGKQFAKKICIGVWVMSVVLCTIVYLVTRFYLNNIARYNNLVFPIATYTASIIFIAAYSAIFLELRKSARNSSSKRGKDNEKEAKEMRFLKLALKTVAVFMVCWIPFSTCSLNMAINGTCGGRSVEYSLFTLAYLNSVINPFIYFSHAQTVLSKQWQRLKVYVGKRRQSDDEKFSSIATASTNAAQESIQ